MTLFQPKEHITKLTRQVHIMLVKDLKAMKAEQLAGKPGGVGRSALHIAAECGMVNRYFANFLTEKQPAARPTPEEREAHLSTFDTLEKALAYLDQETQNLVSVIESLDENTLGEVHNQPLGRPMTLFALAEFAALHMMYHDGQLNYIHTLYGDNEIHWWKE